MTWLALGNLNARYLEIHILFILFLCDNWIKRLIESSLMFIVLGRVITMLSKRKMTGFPARIGAIYGLRIQSCIGLTVPHVPAEEFMLVGI